MELQTDHPTAAYGRHAKMTQAEYDALPVMHGYNLTDFQNIDATYRPSVDTKTIIVSRPGLFGPIYSTYEVEITEQATVSGD